MQEKRKDFRARSRIRAPCSTEPSTELVSYSPACLLRIARIEALHKALVPRQGAYVPWAQDPRELLAIARHWTGRIQNEAG